MVSLADIGNKISEFGQWIRSGFEMIKTGFSNLRSVFWAPVSAAVVAVKGIYGQIITFINEKFTEMHTLTDGLNSDLQSGASDVSAVSMIQTANALFPIDELLGSIVLLFSLWAVCLVVKLAVKLFRTFLLAVI